MPGIHPHLLRSIPLFELLDDDELKALADQLDQENYLAGQTVFKQGDPGGKMYLVQSGEVELFIIDRSKDKVVLEVVKPGEMFGELSLFDQQPRSASARAIQQTLLVAVDRHDLEMLFSRHQDAIFNIMTVFSRRIRETDLLLQERVVARNVNAELAARPTFSQRLADFFSRIAGDMRFVYFSILWFGTWITWNLGLIPGLKPFDPFPFGLLTMIVSLEAIFLATFVMISQNRQAEREKVRNDIEYEVNVQAELGIRDLKERVDDLQELLVNHLSRMNENIDRIQTTTTRSVSDDRPS